MAALQAHWRYTYVDVTYRWIDSIIVRYGVDLMDAYRVAATVVFDTDWVRVLHSELLMDCECHQIRLHCAYFP